MKRTNKLEAMCPHCLHRQEEPVGAISTNCRACGRYFKLSKPTTSRSSKNPRTTNREVTCLECGAPNQVAVAALSTQCIRCLHHLELGDKLVRGNQNGRLFAYDDVIFDVGCSFKGMEATGRRLEVRGKVFSKLRATAEIVTVNGGQLSGELIAPIIRIEKGGKVRVQTVECRQLYVEGELEVSGSMKVQELILRPGSVFSGRLDNSEIRLHVEPGARVTMRSIVCRELLIEGTVTLDYLLQVKRLEIRSSGVLQAPQIRLQQVEVQTGGRLQGRIEVESPETDPVTEPVLEIASASSPYADKKAPLV